MAYATGHPNGGTLCHTCGIGYRYDRDVLIDTIPRRVWLAPSWDYGGYHPSHLTGDESWW